MKKEIKQLLKLILKKDYREYINNILDSISFHLEKESESNNKEVLIIQRKNEMAGTFSDYIVFLAYIEKAIQNNMIPIIDRKTNKNYYLSGPSEDNTWEYFFEQPCQITLEDLSASSYKVSRAYTIDLNAVSLMNCNEPITLNYWREIARKYIRLNDEMKNYVEEWYEKLVKNKRVLGVAIREGYKIWFEKTSVGEGHAFQLEAVDMVKICEEKKKEWDCDYVFVMCQSQETIDVFKKNFGESLLFYPRKRTIIEGHTAHSLRTMEEERQNEKDYITENYLLASCTCLLCSQNSGTEAANIITNGFEHMECIDIGKR